jgi:hypothetical protein
MRSTSIARPGSAGDDRRRAAVVDDQHVHARILAKRREGAHDVVVPVVGGHQHGDIVEQASAGNGRRHGRSLIRM